MLKLLRPQPLYFQRPDGRVFRVDPATRAQVRACLALDPENGNENPLEADARVAAQLRALVGSSGLYMDPATQQPLGAHAALDLGELTAEEERQILWALMAHHMGYSAEVGVAASHLGNAFGPLAERAEPTNSSASTPTPSPSASINASTLRKRIKWRSWIASFCLRLFTRTASAKPGSVPPSMGLD